MSLPVVKICGHCARVLLAAAFKRAESGSLSAWCRACLVRHAENVRRRCARRMTQRAWDSCRSWRKLLRALDASGVVDPNEAVRTRARLESLEEQGACPDTVCDQIRALWPTAPSVAMVEK